MSLVVTILALIGPLCDPAVPPLPTPPGAQVAIRGGVRASAIAAGRRLDRGSRGTRAAAARPCARRGAILSRSRSGRSVSCSLPPRANARCSRRSVLGAEALVLSLSSPVVIRVSVRDRPVARRRTMLECSRARVASSGRSAAARASSSPRSACSPTPTPCPISVIRNRRSWPQSASRATNSRTCSHTWSSAPLVFPLTASRSSSCPRSRSPTSKSQTVRRRSLRSAALASVFPRSAKPASTTPSLESYYAAF